MADSSAFSITIPNLTKIKANFEKYPQISEPVYQRAIVASQVVMAKNTVKGVVPWKTGNLLQTFRFTSGRLWARWFPTANYAGFVEFGTKPHIIKIKNARALANRDTGQIFGTTVHHPGTVANPYMERILEKSTPEINRLFAQAGDIIAKQIAVR